MPPALEGLDDDHVPAAARARRAIVDRFVDVVIGWFGGDLEQFAGAYQTGFARRAGEQTVMADAVEPARQDMDQEAADKPDEVDGSRSRHLSAKMGCCHANPSKGATRHGD